MEATDLASLWDAVPFGAIMLGPSAEVQRVNQYARRIAGRAASMSIGGRLTFVDQADATSFERCWNGALGTRHWFVSHTAPPTALLITTVRRPLSSVPGFVDWPGLVMVWSRDVLPRRVAQPLRDLFGMTPAEATLADALLHSRSLETAAAACRITVSTARTRLKQIFEKTDTHRQTQLIGLLLSIAQIAGVDGPLTR